MKKKYSLDVEIGNEISCEFADGVLKCKKGDKEISKKMNIPKTNIKINDGKIKFLCEMANKKDIAAIRSNVAHIKNMIKGLGKEFVYEMEICNVHFPMSVKSEGEKLRISNFLGEKVDRFAKILPGVSIEIKGQKISISSSDIEKVGQTAANIEKAVKVPKKDRRVFQDGIFITSKPGGDI